MKAVTDHLYLMTDDGSYGEKGLVTQKLEELIKAGNPYDLVIAIGPVIMMKFVAAATKPYRIRTLVSLNPIMVDEDPGGRGGRVKCGASKKECAAWTPRFGAARIDQRAGGPGTALEDDGAGAAKAAQLTGRKRHAHVSLKKKPMREKPDGEDRDFEGAAKAIRPRWRWAEGRLAGPKTAVALLQVDVGFPEFIAKVGGRDFLGAYRESSPPTNALPALSAGGSARRRPSARASACAASRGSRWASAGWSGSSPTGASRERLRRA